MVHISEISNEYAHHICVFMKAISVEKNTFIDISSGRMAA